MKASDVYTIAKALPQEEIARLYDMLKKDVNQNSKIKLRRKKLPDFTVEDGLRHLLENYIK